MIEGIHHITALASDPQQNVDFYTDVLGLRLVKRTVNFDAQDVYHLYYGDEVGRPGTILTFFPFPHAVRGKRGTGEISAVAFVVPEGSLDFWLMRLSRFDIHIDGPENRYNEQVISFQDPDGMEIELMVGPSQAPYRTWSGGPIPRQYAIEKLHGATLLLGRLDETDRLLQKTLGFKFVGGAGKRYRYTIGTDTDVAVVDLIVEPELSPARQSAGSVHHIAWRVADRSLQAQWRKKLLETGLHTTEILDRKYFESVYFREPGGVLFEIATDGPGFVIDEPIQELGTHLELPKWLESERPRLERILLPIKLKTRPALW